MSRWRHRVLALALPAALACSATAPDPGATPPARAAAPAAVDPGPQREAKVPVESTIAELVAEISPSVVSVIVTQKVAAGPQLGPFHGFPGFRGPPRGERQREGAGSGFAIDGGYVVTNEHVVRDAAAVRVRLHDDRELEAEVVGRDPKLDLALLRVKGGELPSVRLGDSDALRVGEHVVAVGNPFGLGHTVTLGIVSAKARTIGAGPYDDFIQTDASINPGNSGGPLFNLRGEVVGINTAIRQGADGIGFAIPVGDLKGVLAQLRDKGFVERGRLGLRFQPVDEPLAKALGLERVVGALVNQIEPQSPAEEAGIAPGDVILAVDGEEVRRADQLPRLVARHAPGSTVELTLRGRSGEAPRRVAVTLDRLDEPTAKPRPARGGERGEGLLGLRVEATAEGLRIVGLERDLGDLRPGDLIVAVDGRPVRSVAELRAAIEASDRPAWLLRVRRGDQERFVGVPRP